MKEKGMNCVHKQRNLEHFDATCLGPTHAPILELGFSSSNSTPIFKMLKTLNINLKKQFIDFISASNSSRYFQNVENIEHKFF
jgi:hypothetical protein